MKVNSFNIEFGYELLSAVPYAYELSLKSRLTETESGYDTDALYYFSPKHISNNITRGWHNMSKSRRGGLPYTFIHQPEQPEKQFPPYKQYYANKEYKYSKPTLCICNRKNTEWGVEAINYFDEKILDWLFKNLKAKYHLIYFPVALPKEFQDNVEPHPLEDEKVARKHKVTLFTDLCAGKSWNETLLKVFANCEHYITMNGGYSILASLFSGTNIIYSKPGTVETREIRMKSFWRWYPNINNVRTLHVPSYEDLKRKVTSLYIREDPCVNILIRTHRPNYLEQCMLSIEMQTYQNINVVLICDSDRSVEYTRKYNARMLRVHPMDTEIKRIKRPTYGVPFPYNKYLAEAQEKVQGFVMFLDDDDKLVDPDSVKNIAEHLEKDTLLVWKVDYNGQGIKPSFSFGKEVTLYDIGGIGFSYHTNHIQLTDWSEWKRADYRTASKLSKVLKVKWLDQVITGLQDTQHRGTSGDLPGIPNTVKLKLTYPGGRSQVQEFKYGELEQYKDYFERQKICIEQMT